MKTLIFYSNRTTPKTKIEVKVYTTQRGMLRAINNFCGKSGWPLQDHFKTSSLMGFHTTCWFKKSRPKLWSQVIFLHEQDDHMIDTITHEIVHATTKIFLRRYGQNFLRYHEEKFAKDIGELTGRVVTLLGLDK